MSQVDELTAQQKRAEAAAQTAEAPAASTVGRKRISGEVVEGQPLTLSADGLAFVVAGK